MNKQFSKHFVSINNKKYQFTLKVGKKTTYFECKVANIAQDFLNEDIPALIVDLPELILEELNYKSSQDCVIRFRLSEEDKKKITQNAYKSGYGSVSDFLRHLALKS